MQSNDSLTETQPRSMIFSTPISSILPLTAAPQNSTYSENQNSTLCEGRQGNLGFLFFNFFATVMARIIFRPMKMLPAQIGRPAFTRQQPFRAISIEPIGQERRQIQARRPKD